jgi:3-isopropylmalate/(R)-2-methylmalate dehydratase small subunit
MTPFTQLSADACAIPVANVDTDQLIPARFMKEPRSVGYGQFLLHDLRFNSDGSANTDFPLNRPEADAARILVARRNFGAGSSREAAVYALVDAGYLCVIAPSFGDIFASNSVNNGLLPATVSESDCESLLISLAGNSGTVQVDLNANEIRCGALTVSFSINPTWRTKLLNGWDDIDLTEARNKEIDQFKEHYFRGFPWSISSLPIKTTDSST